VFFQYGTYRHASGEVTLAIALRPLFNKREERYADQVNFKIDGFQQAVSVTGLTVALALLENAYAFDYKDAGLYNDDGTVLSPRHYLKNSQSIDGVRVIRGVEYPLGKGAEYSTYRYYSIELEAKIKRNNYNQLDFSETLNMSGGGPRFVLIETRNGPPKKQQTSEQTTFHATQSGSATGLYGYPTPPPPLFPGDEHINQRSIRKDSPKRTAQNLFDWTIHWNYVFESADPLVSNPGVPPPNAG
jgi:hypothetical protein